MAKKIGRKAARKKAGRSALHAGPARSGAPANKGKKKSSKKKSSKKKSSKKKSSKKKSSSARRSAASPSAPAPAVRVRMYRQGLGDCFLVTFGLGGDERHMLIDCGTLGGTTTGVKLKDVVADIAETTGGRLDVLVATHEHHDHLCGFNSEAEAFAEMEVGHVWLAWTEDPDDPLARQLARSRDDLGRALCAAAGLASAGDLGADLGGHLDGLLGFFGEASPGAAGFAKTVHQAMEFVRRDLGAPVTYHTPGRSPVEIERIPGFRFYMLGPPRSRETLKALGDHGSDQLYGLAAACAAAAAAGAETGEDAESPFDIRYRRGEAEARRMYPAYFEPEDEWRRVDSAWLGVFSDLALQLDEMTNNTSLVLAIERIADGRVLLFPGDAQEGNWLSWHEPSMRWTLAQEDGSERVVSAEELLGRAVFYKVGHHASHNATLRERGLELMSREDELVAFIPVDRAVALGRNPQGSWRMPARALYRRLLERCQGRVVRSDIGWAVPRAASAAQRRVEEELDGVASDDSWTAWRESQHRAADEKRVTISAAWVDFFLD